MWLKIKDVINLDIDSVERTIQHGKVIKSKPLLRQLYSQWYLELRELSGYNPNGKYIELGSGSGFIKEYMPNVLTSDILSVPGLDLVFDATKMPFDDNSIDGIIMIDVFHHIPDVKLFLSEVNRVLKKKGVLVMSEPCNSLWSRFIYKNFHHETFDENGGWLLDSSNPLSSANGALPYIVFERDVSIFSMTYPSLKLEKIKYHTPLLYLISGGVSHKQLVPNFLIPIFRQIDKRFSSSIFSMFAMYVVRKK